MTTLLDALTSLVTPATGEIAKNFGESETTITGGMHATFASILGGLLAKARDQGAFRRIFDFIGSYPGGTSASDISNVLGGLGGNGLAATAGTNFLNSLFDGHTAVAENALARAVNFENPSSATSLFSLAAPLALGFLGKRSRDGGLNAAGLANVLSRERESIVAAVPPELTNFISNNAPVARVDSSEWRRASDAGRSYSAPPTNMPRTGRWFWPVAGIAALALLWFTISQRRARVNARENIGSAVVDTVTNRGGRVVGTAGGEVSGAVGGLGAITTKVLPNGVALRVPDNGVESQLVGFIDDRARPVDETTWFNFDRVTFGNNSATITPESHDQLNNIAAILKAYPSVNVTVGGYTDNVGGAAANRRLSQRRADAVQRELIRRGIPLSRVNAKGYGEEHPVADNSTEEGRAQNRRIALHVTHK